MSDRTGIDGLRTLVSEAEQTAEAFTCERNGHAWETDGGRACPRDCEDSQTVYRCRRCGVHDYGDPGGPAHEDCSGTRCCDGSTESEREELAHE